MNKHLISNLIFFLFLLCKNCPLNAQVTPLPNAHAHNDYKHKNPLSDALSNGFTSIEADIFLKRNQLIISHTRPLLFKKRTLKNLYLQPLLTRLEQNGGDIYKDDSCKLILLVDLKTNADATYRLLEKELQTYSKMLTSYENGIVTKRAVTIILTGNKPHETLQNSKIRYAFIDQSLLSLDEKKGIDLYPLSSTKYSNVMNWKGKGNIPESEQKKLKALCSKAHEQGKKVRLWASPENEKVWKELLDCGVDLINTDQLEDLKKFLLTRGPQ